MTADVDVGFAANSARFIPNNCILIVKNAAASKVVFTPFKLLRVLGCDDGIVEGWDDGCPVGCEDG